MSTNISTTPVVFDSQGTLLAGRIHRPAGTLSERRPIVLVTGSWLTVKEQMADTYALALAERGYTTMTFDFAGYGQSAGQPRYLEMPVRKIADIVAAAEFASTLSFVPPGGVGYLGICASAQYALAAIARGARIDAFASVAGWIHDLPSVAPFYGGQEGVRLRLDRAQAALERYLASGDVVTVPAYEPGNDRAGMSFAMDYYGNSRRGVVPEWDNAMAEMSWLHWLTYDGRAAAPGIDVPSLFVHSDGSVFPDHVRAFAEQMPGPADVVWGDGEQTDFYDQPDQVAFAVDAADRHFSKVLGGMG